MQSRILNFAKVRVSYSEVGNAPEVFIAIPTYEIKDGAVTTVTRRPNSNLKPERTKAWEAGLNLAMFDSKFRLDATFYYSRTLNQFFERQLTPSTGSHPRFSTEAASTTKGIELSARFSNTWGDLSWTTYLNYSINRNTVKTSHPTTLTPSPANPHPSPR